MKREAIAGAERRGHKLKSFDKYKDSEVYYSTFCARCSAYLHVTALRISGRAVEGPCQRVCNCGHPLTPDDLDGQCTGCRGNELVLYPKTPAVSAKDMRFIEYCRKANREYEPSPEHLSDYFWRCQDCARRLGPGYQGDPDEQGYCGACVASKKIWAKREGDAIEAAGGLRAWKRKRIINKLLTAVDYAALCIAMIVGVGLGVPCLFIMLQGAVRALGEELRTLGPFDSTGAVVLIVILASFAWCALRWKAINRNPREKL